MEESVRDYIDTRRIVRDHQGDLQRLAFQASEARLKPATAPLVPLLARPGWIRDVPIPISQVSLRYLPGAQVERWREAQQAASTLMPYLPGSVQRTTYSQAMVELEHRPELFNGFAYRLLDVDVDVDVDVEGQGVSLSFGEGRYFDYLDTGEVLAYEAARAWRGGRRAPHDFRRLRLRRMLADPFDFGNRVTSCGVVTLTLRTSAQGTGFYLHRRNPLAGNVASGQLHVVPAGELAPSNITTEAIRSDLSLWKNIVREYAEELLGLPDARGKGGRVADFQHAPPFSDFDVAVAAGEIKCYFLGIGLDPLTWKPEILTACVFAEEAFDRILRPALIEAAPPEVGDFETEGTILMGVNGYGMPFEHEQVQSYLSSDMRDAGRACLSLAWHHRGHLGVE